MQDQARPLSPSKAKEIKPLPKPEWLKIRPPSGENYVFIKKLLRDRTLHTVCEEAHCPNLTECWSGGTATFMIGGDTCTRACRFCAIKTARLPPPLDPDEPKKIGESVGSMGLKYVVLTSVDRDDMLDGGAKHFHDTITSIKLRDRRVLIEALVPDFRGDTSCIETIVHSRLDVFAQNIETVKRLTYRVRDPRAGYDQTMHVLQYAKMYAESREIPLITKSSIMLGLGESEEEIVETMHDLLKHRVEVLTLGQYLRPTLEHLPVEKFYTPDEFTSLGKLGEDMGFRYVASGPMVRSSYKAAEFFIESELKNKNEVERTT